MTQTRTKEYLGDGVYVDFDGYQFVLTAENGIEATNTIYLEPAAFVMLQRYVNAITRRHAVAEAE